MVQNVRVFCFDRRNVALIGWHCLAAWHENITQRAATRDQQPPSRQQEGTLAL
jgi:hypothetical protein